MDEADGTVLGFVLSVSLKALVHGLSSDVTQLLTRS
jgi:uncharacterized membrane protein required for colicin V production